MKAILELPFPPSLNHLYANGKRGRFTSKRYAAWQAEAWARLLTQPRPRFISPVEVTMTFCPPDKRRRDLFNLEKACSDILVKAGILADDSLIHRGTLQWGDCAGTRIEIKPLSESIEP